MFSFWRPPSTINGQRDTFTWTNYTLMVRILYTSIIAWKELEGEVVDGTERAMELLRDAYAICGENIEMSADAERTHQGLKKQLSQHGIPLAEVIGTLKAPIDLQSTASSMEPESASTATTESTLTMESGAPIDFESLLRDDMTLDDDGWQELQKYLQLPGDKPAQNEG